MKSDSEDRISLIKDIIRRIEERFAGTLVVWRNTGTFSDDFKDDTEVFEAYMVGEEAYEDFIDFIWELANKYAYPNGFSIMVHDLTPEETKEYRSREYEEGMRERRKLIEIELVPVAWWSLGSRTRRSNGNHQEWDSKHSPDLRPRIPRADVLNIGRAA